MELKDTYYRNAKTRRRTKKKTHERRKTAGCAGFQVCITCLSWISAVRNALIRFWRSSVVNLCVYVCAREGKEERREFENDGIAFANHSPDVR